jgi:ribosomal protein S18 acetylase RimI-like enzyme
MVTQAYASIRECREDDLAWFWRLGSTSHLQHCHREFARAQSGETLILVAVDENDAPIGKLHIDFVQRASEQAATIGSAAVLDSIQSRGIGTALIHAAEARIQERGLHAAEVGVDDENPRARRLYERLGYREFARETFTYEVDGPTATPVVVSNPGALLRKRLERVG